MPDLPPHIALELDHLGIVLLVKKPERKPIPAPQLAGWVPSYKGEEPPW